MQAGSLGAALALALAVLLPPPPAAAQEPADTAQDAVPRAGRADTPQHEADRPAGAAAADTFRLRDIVVTAARLPIRLADAPGTITVLHGGDLRERGIRYVSDALRTVAGLTVVQSAGPGALTSVFIRGGESDYVQVLVDGIQVNDPGGAFDWAHLRAEDIERIEILRGPGSVLYGSDAAAGVIQVFTRSGGPPRLEVGASSGFGDKRADDADGTYRTRAFDASLSGATMLSRPGIRLNYGATAARHESNGLYAFNSDYDNTAVTGRLQLITPRLDAALTARASDNTYHYPTSGSGAIVDTNQFSTGDTRSFGLDAGYRLTPALELRMLATAHSADSRTEDPPEPGADARYWRTSEQTRRKLDARMNARFGPAAVVTGGVEREWQDAATAYESVSEFGTFGETTDDERSNTGWYAQLHTTRLAGVAATVGGRIDRNDEFGTFHTGRAALSWTPLEGSRAHAAWGTAFKEPTFYENYATGFVRGNPHLEPEHVRSLEAGVEHAFAGGRFSAGATWFRQRFRNLIQYTAAAPDPEAPNYFNVGSARARGVELSARALLGGLSAAAQYTYTSTAVTDAGFGGDMAFRQDQPLLRRPRHAATVTAAMPVLPSLRGFVELRHTGSRDDLDFTDPARWDGVRVRMPAFTTLDAGAEIRALRTAATDVAVTLRVLNAFDTRYEEIYNFPAAGRVLQVGVRAGRGL
jgi:vitamin B12 transporter